jgi:nicotinate-nucleotide adenylyltransferase
MRCNQSRVGIYAGTFDPVHAGHISFALYAQQRAQLDSVYFLPERRPRYKPQVEHLAHRVAMLKEALAPYPSLGVIELVDTRFTVKRTVPQLRGLFGDSQLVYLFGSDVFRHIPQWSLAASLSEGAEFVVGIRAHDNAAEIEEVGAMLKGMAGPITVLDSLYPDVSSRHIREALMHKRDAPGMLDSVKRYAAREWLYVHIPKRSITPKA